MNNLFHNNISFNTTDKAELYKIWDNDLQKSNKKRNRWEWGLGIATLFVVFGDTAILKTSFIGITIFSSVQVIKYFIEEAHINYLMHKIDIDELNFKD